LRGVPQSGDDDNELDDISFSVVDAKDSPFQDKPEKKASDKPVARGGKRYPGTDIATTIWGLAGYGVALRGEPEHIAAPVGMMMQLQAPDAGRRIARIIAESPLSSWLGPLGKELGWVGELVPLLAPPLLVGAIAARPEIAPAMEPMLKAVLVPLAVELRKAQREAAQATGLVNELDEEIADNVNGMFNTLFGSSVRNAADGPTETP